MTNRNLASLFGVLAAVATGIAFVTIMRRKKTPPILTWSCTCKCGKNYYKVGGVTDGLECFYLDGTECHDEDGKKHKLEDCWMRYAQSGVEGQVVA